MGLAAETTYGVAASISTFTPVGSPKVTPGVKWLDDSDFRGSPVMHYDQVQGVFNAQYDHKVFTYTDVYPNILRAALGSTDTVASVGGGQYTHTIGLINSPNTGSQPPSYTIVNDSVDNTYQLTASRLDSLSVAFTADAAVENTVTWRSNAASVVASVSNAGAESTQHLIPAWNCAASIGGSTVTVVESVQLDIKRNTSQIYTLGSQSAISNFAGPLVVEGKATFVMAAGITNSYYANALVRDQQQIILSLIDPQTGYFINYTMSACQLEAPIVNQGKAYLTLDTNFVAVANTTDAIAGYGGYSPIKCMVQNNISTAY
jgi:hypothetical protein